MLASDAVTLVASGLKFSFGTSRNLMSCPKASLTRIGTCAMANPNFDGGTLELVLNDLPDAFPPESWREIFLLAPALPDCAVCGELATRVFL